MSTEDTLRQIQTRVSQVQSKIARASVEKDNAEAKIREAKKVLTDEFGISTGEDAARVRAELEASLAEAVASVEQALVEAGA